MKEKEFKESILHRLNPFFNIREEWPGVCFGNKVIIDALIKPKDITGWLNPDIIFGIEFKASKIGIGATSDHVKQTIDYSYSEFQGIGKIPILLCPGINIIDEGILNSTQLQFNKETSFLLRVLSRFNIGEIKDGHNGLSFIFSGCENIWSEKRGIARGRSYNFHPKTGCK